MVEWLFLTVQWGCLLFVIVGFPDDTYLLFLEHSHGEAYLFNTLPPGICFLSADFL